MEVERRRLLDRGGVFPEAQARSIYIHSAFCLRKASHCSGPGSERENE